MPAEGALRNRLGPGDALIETLRWEPAHGPVRLERHLARMRASANSFAIPFDRDHAEEALAAATGGDKPLRVRLSLGADGAFEATAAPFDPPAPDTLWRLAVARTRISSGDPLVRHKTTRRATCERARAEFSPREADEVILLNERGEVCEGTITNIFVETGTGPMLTPALACGLLPGVLRAEMIERRQAEEAVIDPAALRSARAIFVGNSLRGMIRAGISEAWNPVL